jgi:lipopolysaccharide biosynthesis glycosyltransferase
VSKSSPLSLLDALVFSTYRIKEAKAPARQMRHIIFGIDANYFEHAWVTLLTVLQNESEGHCHFHFITADDLRGKFSLLEEFMAPLDCTISLHEVELKVLEQLPASLVFPASIYLRLLAPYVLQGEEQALYLDADVVCLKPLAGLWNSLDGRNALLAAVEDGPVAVVERVQALGLKAGRYFNSGVLLMPLERWRRERVTEKVLACIGSHQQRLKYPDQDALNIVLEGAVHYLPPAFNTQCQLGVSQGALSEDTVLLHYTGVDKPWHVWSDQPQAFHYRAARELLPWGREPYDAPRKPRQFKSMSRYCARHGKRVASYFWLAKYRFYRLYNKVFSNE